MGSHVAARLLGPEHVGCGQPQKLPPAHNPNLQVGGVPRHGTQSSLKGYNSSTSIHSNCAFLRLCRRGKTKTVASGTVHPSDANLHFLAVQAWKYKNDDERA